MLIMGPLRIRLVNCIDDYIEIEIDIIKNARCCNIIIIPIQLFGNPILIEPSICFPNIWYILKCCNENFLNQIAYIALIIINIFFTRITLSNPILNGDL